MKLSIGTVQFGMDYGAFNTSGQVNFENIVKILNLAKTVNIDTLDTAHTYGESEVALGRLHAAESFKTVTKCPPLNDTNTPSIAIRSYFQKSLERLDADRIYGYLLHRSKDLLGGNGQEIWRTLCELRDEGKVERIGVSAYNAAEIGDLLLHFPLSLAQLPANALMNWYYDADFLALCTKNNTELHTRSTFLQGFLLADPDKLTGHLSSWKNVLANFRNRASDLQLTPLQAALSAVLPQQAISKVIIGVDSERQLEQILQAVKNININPNAFRDIVANDQRLTDPRLWKN